MKLLNLSPNADFYLKFQSQLTVISSNVLYITHEVDKIKKIVNNLKVSEDTQTQVDDYFSDKERESFQETSPQTDDAEQRPE